MPLGPASVRTGKHTSDPIANKSLTSIIPKKLWSYAGAPKDASKGFDGQYEDVPVHRPYRPLRGRSLRFMVRQSAQAVRQDVSLGDFNEKISEY